MSSPSLDSIKSKLRLHGLIWAIMIPYGYISYVAIKFFHEIIGHGMISSFFGIEWHGFGLTSVSVTIPQGTSAWAYAAFYLSGNAAVFLSGIVIFKLISRRIKRPSIRFMLVTISTVCFLTTTLPAALIFWMTDNDYISFLISTGNASLPLTLLTSLFGALAFFYTGSYSLTRLLEEAWTGLDRPDNKYRFAFMTIGVPLNFMFLILTLYFSLIDSNNAWLILSIVMALWFNLSLPSISAQVKVQPDRKRIRKIGLLIISSIALLLLIVHYTTLNMMITW